MVTELPVFWAEYISQIKTLSAKTMHFELYHSSIIVTIFCINTNTWIIWLFDSEEQTIIILQKDY